MHIIYLSIIALLLLKIFKKAIRINGYEDEENSREIENRHCECDNTDCMVHRTDYILIKNIPKDTDKHLWTNGDCCRCEECTDRYHKEIIK